MRPFSIEIQSFWAWTHKFWGMRVILVQWVTCPCFPLFNHYFYEKLSLYIQIPIPNKYLGCGYKGLVFCRNNGWVMKNMYKGLSVPKWVLIVWPKIPQMPQNLFAQFVFPSPKVLDFTEKRLHWASIVRAC